jgi:hypothetical protein
MIPPIRFVRHFCDPFNPGQMFVHLFALEVLATHGVAGVVAFSSGMPVTHFAQSG